MNTEPQDTGIIRLATFLEILCIGVPLDVILGMSEADALMVLEAYVDAVDAQERPN